MPETRRERGSYYTPRPVVDLALSLADVTAGRRCRVLDPTCGDGAFLAGARERLGQAASLVGVEIDPDAARAAAARSGAEVTCADLFALPAEAIGTADAVVGNPPYVRQERLGADGKARARARLRADFPDIPGSLLDRLTGRGDLAVACAARALRLVRPGGRVALVVSSALLDAAYARPLWELARAVARVDAIVDAPRERWFADAAVNAMIVVFQARGDGKGRGGDETVTVAKLTVPTREAAARTRRRRDLDRGASVREVPESRPERWAAALRSAPAWLEFEAIAAQALAPLGELAAVRRGVTSGANDVFYLPRSRAKELEIEPELLVPLLRAPPRRGDARVIVDPGVMPHVALAIPPDTAGRDWERFPAAARYLAARADAARRPTLRHRRPWWALTQAPARLFLTKAYAGRFVQQLSRSPVIADQRVYALHPAPGVDLEVLAGVLNATLTALALESLGRASMGEGALEWTVAGARRLPVVDPRRLSRRQADRVRAALRRLSRRAVGDARAERDRPDRMALDRAVCAACPGAVPLLPDLHAGLAAAVGAREERAAGGPRRALARPP